MVKFASRKEAVLSPAGTPKTPFTWPVRVFYEDTDAGGVVYYANYLRFMERARTEWLRQVGFEHERFKREHSALFIVRAVAVKYLKPARLDDALSVTVVPQELSAYQIHLAQEVLRVAPGGSGATEALTRASVSIACVDSVSFKPKILPEALIAKLNEAQ